MSGLNEAIPTMKTPTGPASVSTISTMPLAMSSAESYSLGKHSICRENIDNCDLGVGCSKHLVTNSENPNSWNIIWQHQKVRMWHNLIIDVTI